MKVLPLLTVIAASTLIGACSSQLQWSNLDGSSPDTAELQEASKTCRIDKKLAALENADSERGSKVRKAKSDEARMLFNEDFDQVRKQVYREIDTCMSRQGYKR